MLAFYAENNAVHTRPYPNAAEVLADLDDRGIAMVVVTNKFESFAAEILDQLGLSNRFVTLIGGDSLGKDAEGNFRAKPSADPIHAAIERCGSQSFAFVGDSSYDINAARAADVPVIAAGYGYCDKPADQLGADGVIDRFDALIPALRQIDGASRSIDEGAR